MKTSHSPIIEAILAGEHDKELDKMDSAIRHRKKLMFRVGSKVKLTGTRNPEIDGKTGVVMKVNAKRITVGLGERQPYGGYEQEFLVPVSMLEVA